MTKIILASQSPARKKLLSQLGLKFEVVPAEIDEDKIRESSPAATVKKIALLKAKEILRKQKWILSLRGRERIIYNLNSEENELVVISADTMVYLPHGIRSTVDGVRQKNGQFIGKPKNKNEAKQILTKLSGTTHWLYSGICVLHVWPSVIASPDVTSGRGNLVKLRLLRRSTPCNDNIRVYLDFDKSKVTFRKLSEKEIDEYVNNNPIHLWAGAYTIEKGTAGASFIKTIKGSSSNVLGLPVKKLKKILSDLGCLSHLGNLS